MKAKITVAKDSANLIKHISEVKNGIRCNCLCLQCGKPLIAANNGKIQEHHFRHKTETSCNGSPETGLHKLAKRIISEANKIHINKKEIFYYNETKIEKSVNGIIPDIQLINSDGTVWLVEIAVTHFINDIKLSKIKSYKLNCIEINLKNINRYISIQELKDILLNDLKNREVLSRNITSQVEIPEINNSFLSHILSWLSWVLGIFFTILLIKDFFKKR